MAQRKSGIGRGLDALFLETFDEEKKPNGVEKIKTSLIDPKSGQPRKTFDADGLAAAVRRVSVVAQSNPSVRLSAVRTLIGEVELHAVSQDRGESTEAVPAEVEGEDVVIHLNNRYLTDGVGHMSGEVTLRLNGPERPVVLETHDVVDFTYLLMPVRG